MPKKSKKAQVDKLDALLHDIMCLLKGNRCERCGASGDVVVLDVHHPNKKQTIALRYFVLGCVLLCRVKCHSGWAEKEPKEQKQWFIDKRGQELWDKLVELRRTHKMPLDVAEKELNEYNLSNT